MEWLGTYLFRHGYIKENEIDVIRYALELIVSEYLITSIVFVILMILGYGIEAFIHLLVFTYLRQELGGYHAKTMVGCAMVSTILFVVGTLVDLDSWNIILFVVDILVLATYLIRKQRNRVLITSIIFLLIWVFISKFSLINVISITAAEVIVLILFEKREEDNHE